MTRDLIIGIIVSALLHGGFFASSLIKFEKPQVAVVEEEPVIELIPMPELDIEEPEPITNDQEPAEVIEFAPPTQADVPQIPTPDAFVQPLQPPPPEGLKPVAGAISIPQSRVSGLGQGIEVFDISTLDQRPVPRVQIQPQYPFEMRRAGIEGEVVVEFIVDTNGDVRNPFVVRSSQREFEAAAIQAVSKWKFRPGRRGGRAVNTSRVQQLFSFKINE
jgi:protein TonB